MEDFLLPGVKEFTKPLLSIPAHRFLFYPGNVETEEYKDLLQLEDCEFEVIAYVTPKGCVCELVLGGETENVEPMLTEVTQKDE